MRSEVVALKVRGVVYSSVSGETAFIRRRRSRLPDNPLEGAWLPGALDTVFRSELKELHFVTHTDNLLSIWKHGILSNRRAKRLKPTSVAMSEIQKERAKKRVPQGRRLHEYANLYFCARNPMLYKRKQQHANLCVLRVSTDVLDLPGVVVTDGNAASNYTRFAAAPEGLQHVSRELTFAEWWTSSDPIEKWERTRRKCAEVLVPDTVSRKKILGAYVSCQEALERFEAINVPLEAEIDAHLFFL